MLSEDSHTSNFARKIRKILSTCDISQRNKVTNKSSTAPMQPIIMNRPLELLSIDYYGPLLTAQLGFKYILAVIDRLRKYVKLYTLRQVTAKITIEKIFDDYIPNFGKPEAIIMDHETQFTSGVYRKKLEH